MVRWSISYLQPEKIFVQPPPSQQLSSPIFFVTKSSTHIFAVFLIRPPLPFTISPQSLPSSFPQHLRQPVKLVGKSQPIRWANFPRNSLVLWKSLPKASKKTCSSIMASSSQHRLWTMKNGWKPPSLPCDVEDSGVLKRSSFSRKTTSSLAP